MLTSSRKSVTKGVTDSKLVQNIVCTKYTCFGFPWVLFLFLCCTLLSETNMFRNKTTLSIVSDPQALQFLYPDFVFVHIYRKVMHTSQELLPLDRNSKSFERDKERLIVLRYVKTSTILGFQPLDWMENPERRLTMDLMSEGQFRTEALSAKRVRMQVVAWHVHN